MMTNKTFTKMMKMILETQDLDITTTKNNQLHSKHRNQTQINILEALLRDFKIKMQRIEFHQI